MKVRRRYASVAAIAACIALRAASAPALPEETLKLLVGAGVTYDDNLLQYSDGQIADFNAGAHVDRYSIESVDDVQVEPTAGLAYEQDRGDGAGRLVRVRWTGTVQARNATADHGAGSLLWRESWRNGRSVSVTAYRLPNYYLRQLLDEDVPVAPGVSRYRRATLDLTLGSITWREHVAGRAHASAAYQYERRDYSDDFIERDSNTHEAGGGLDWSGEGEQWGTGMTAAYRTSDARGEDGDEAPGVPPDDPNVSYHGIVAGGSGTLVLAHGHSGRLSARAGYEFRTRHYTSELPTDGSHFRRKDRLQHAEAGLRWNPRGPFSLAVLYEYETNHAAFGAPNPPATDPSSYTQHRIGASISWGVTLWKRAADIP